MSNAKPAAKTKGEIRQKGEGKIHPKSVDKEGNPSQRWGQQGEVAPSLPITTRTHGAVVRDGVHTEGQLPAWVTQQLLALGEGFGNHLALLDPLGLVVALPCQPGDEVGTCGGPWHEVHTPWGLSLFGRGAPGARDCAGWVSCGGGGVLQPQHTTPFPILL